MIARHWRGWTTLADAPAYQSLLTETVLPGLKNIEGYQGGYFLRQDDDREAEIVVINFFDSLESVKQQTRAITIRLQYSSRRPSAYCRGLRMPRTTMRYGQRVREDSSQFCSTL
jgi:hypothetical protein